MPNTDKVTVRLTAAGQAHANGQALAVHGGRVALTFNGDDVQTVHLTTWHEVFASSMIGGQPIFEIVADSAQ